MSKRSKKEYWNQVINTWLSSGQQVATFCKENKVALASFYQWRNRLMPDYPKRSKAHFKGLRTSKLFVPIQVNTHNNKMSPFSTDEALTLHYPNGCYLRLNKHVDPEIVRKFNKVMGI
jgi:hypothetical protein